MAESIASAVSVLVVDDDPSARELLCLHLRNEGYRVTSAEDAIVAGRALFASPPDVMVVDVEMPFLSGLEFISIVLADTTLTEIPAVVFISAHEQYRERAEALGLMFLGKPIQKARFLDAVSSAAATKRAASARTAHA